MSIGFASSMASTIEAPLSCGEGKGHPEGNGTPNSVWSQKAAHPQEKVNMWSTNVKSGERSENAFTSSCLIVSFKYTDCNVSLISSEKTV